MSTPMTYTTQINQQIGETNEIINITFQYGQDFTGDGFDDVRVTLSLAPESNSSTEDLIGVAFDIQDDNVAGLTVQDISTATAFGSLSTYTPTSVIGANLVSDGGNKNNPMLDPGFSTSGGSLGENGEPYDVGIQFSAEGSGEGIVQSASFVLSIPGVNIDAEALLDTTDWWVRLQSTSDSGTGDSAKMALFNLDLPSPPSEPPPPAENGVANTPGFWKNHYSESGWQAYGVQAYNPSDKFANVFGLISNFDFNAKVRGSQDTLLDALAAGGGGVNALARAATAALLNAASDPLTGINYLYTDDDALANGMNEVFGVTEMDIPLWTQVDLDSVLQTLSIIDVNGDGRIGISELVTSVQDAFGKIPGHLEVNQVATALDVMNNMPNLEVGDF